MKSYFSERIACATFNVTVGALISGFKSYVATFGEGTKILSSPAYGSSTPPLKKNVTCAYFSVSAIRSWVKPALLIISPSPFETLSGGYATVTFKPSSYCAIVTKGTVFNSSTRGKPSNLSSVKACVISRPRSGRKLKKIIPSLVLTPS